MTTPTKNEPDVLCCPWCASDKIAAEGTTERISMVCQKCLARGPEVNAGEGRDAAIKAWNVRYGCQPNPPHRSEGWVCARCGVTVSHAVYYGKERWKHVQNGKGGTKPTCGQRPVPVPRIKV